MLGSYTVGPSMCGDEDKVWIFAPSGEGGDFPRSGMEAALAEGFAAGDMQGALGRSFWDRF